MRVLSAALTAMLALGGCSGIIPGVEAPPPRIYDLTPKSTYPDDLPDVDWQLIVETPTAAASLNTPRIAVRHSLTTLDYFERAVWTDVAPAMVQTLMIESFENTDKIVAIGRESVGLRSDYVLKVELREFQAEMGVGPPEAHVRLIARLVKMPEREIVDWVSANHRATADSQTMDDIVAAFDRALGSALKDVVIWTLRTGDAHAG
jgi:cholesterol transport system auxiliary component